MLRNAPKHKEYLLQVGYNEAGITLADRTARGVAWTSTTAATLPPEIISQHKHQTHKPRRHWLEQ